MSCKGGEGKVYKFIVVGEEEMQIKLEDQKQKVGILIEKCNDNEEVKNSGRNNSISESNHGKSQHLSDSSSSSGSGKQSPEGGIEESQYELDSCTYAGANEFREFTQRKKASKDNRT